jgi:hypothetical protein
MDRPKGWLMAIDINLADEQEISTTDTIDFSSGLTLGGFSDHNYGAIPSLTTTDLSSLTTSSITIGNTSGHGYTIGNGGVGLGNSNVVWTTSGTSTGINWNQSAVGGIYHNPAMEVNQGGKLALKGENADIDINGKSMVKWMQAMEERMNWMQPNVELEKEWDDLKKLGDRYRKLEQKCKEKAEMWKKLKSMPKPEIR